MHDSEGSGEAPKDGSWTVLVLLRVTICKCKTHHGHYHQFFPVCTSVRLKMLLNIVGQGCKIFIDCITNSKFGFKLMLLCLSGFVLSNRVPSQGKGNSQNASKCINVIENMKKAYFISILFCYIISDSFLIFFILSIRWVFFESLYISFWRHYMINV